MNANPLQENVENLTPQERDEAISHAISFYLRYLCVAGGGAPRNQWRAGITGLARLQERRQEHIDANQYDRIPNHWIQSETDSLNIARETERILIEGFGFGGNYGGLNPNGPTFIIYLCREP